MFLCIPGILDETALTEIREAIASLEFEDGRATAGWHAREVKRNRQAVPTPALRHVQRTITQALENNAIFRAAAQPRHVAPPLISRYAGGEAYGAHVDDALMGERTPIRSDLSVTVFLVPLADYEGGELVAETLAGEDAVRLEAGSAVVYPSGLLHRVAPVTRGERLVAVTWVQSFVRDAAAREILFDLERVRREVFAAQGKGRAFDLVCKTYANLLRRWADT